VPECGNITLVPEGDVYVGGWMIGSHSDSLVPLVPESNCGPQMVKPYADYPGNRKLHEHDFFLMSEPVTTECYAQCFTAGACTAPVPDQTDPLTNGTAPNGKTETWQQRVGSAVWGDYYQATAFCQWLGGRLPTAAELSRAAQSDAPGYGVAAMTAALFACRSNPGSSLCYELGHSMNLNEAPPPTLGPVGQVPQDTGPFGHKDIFGGPAEWTQSWCDWDQTRFCALQDGAADPDPVPAGAGQRCLVQFATGVASILTSAQLPADATPSAGSPLTDPSASRYFYGYRCAFDALP
jgi:formylglycine-generating enzyme required for sulfatase activity